MMDIRLSRPGDLGALSEIWNASFPGDEAFADWFLKNVYAPEKTLVFEDGGRAAAMLHLLPMRFRTGGLETPAAYVYAVATLPDYRGRGVAAALLEEAAALEKERGTALLMLVPQSAGLFEYYRRQGFQNALYRARRVISAAAVPAGFSTDGALGVSEMNDLYEAALDGRGRVARAEADWGRSLSYLRAVGVRRNGRLEGYTVYDPEGGIREMIARDSESMRALEAAAHKHLGVSEAVAFGPDGLSEPYGMARALRPGLIIRDGYAGLMLD